VKQAIEFLGHGITIEPKPNFSPIDSELRLTYTPTFPALTIRSIISAITSVDLSLKVSLVQEPTIEERAEALTRKEQRSLLIRLITAFIFSIPTFIFGIVFMSLVPPESSVRHYFEQSMWVDNTSRTVWILFFIATPVWLFVADIFHRKALTELTILWRPGSRTPVYQRFLKFGSMNLLV
jgi:P-type Cu+ transporter